MFLVNNFFPVIAENWILILVFFSIAIIYSSVGFGGGSSYLAGLSFTALPFIEIRSIALICNITVVSGNTWLFIKNNIFDWKKIIPLVVLSVPMAFFGGLIKLEQDVFYIVLACSLIIAGIFTWLTKLFQENEFKNNSVLLNLFLGGIIGFLSGLVGIGGGIFLAPVLYLTKWDSPKKIAAASSFFILLNSVSGLIGQSQHKDFSINYHLVALLVLSVFIGGQIGARLTVKIIKPTLLKRMTATLIIFVGIKLILNHL